MSDRLSFPACRMGRRIFLAVATAGLLLLSNVSHASEAVTNRFDLFVPVTLSALEISSAVGIVPAPVVVCAALRCEAISNFVQKVLR